MEDYKNNNSFNTESSDGGYYFDSNGEKTVYASYGDNGFEADEVNNQNEENAFDNQSDEAADDEFENAFDSQQDPPKENFDYSEYKPVKKKKRMSRGAIVFSVLLFTFAGLLLVLASVLLIFGNNYLGGKNETYLLNSDATDVYPEEIDLTPLATPVSHYDIIPVKFHFVDRELSCNIIPMGLDKDGSMATTNSEKTLSWLSVKPYVVPGDVGNAVLSGHNQWKGKAGIFSYLKKMNKGEKVAVTFDNGTSRYFEVVEKYECKYNDPGPMENMGFDEPVLTLITCAGDWNDDIGTSKTRIVVICKPVSAK